MSKNQVPVGHIHTHSPQLPWINEKTKTWWIGNHDTKQPYRGLKGDSVKGDKGDRGNMWIHIDQSTEIAPENSRDYDYLISSASNPISVAGVSVSNGEYVQVLSVNPFQVSGVIGNLKGNDGTDGEDGEGIPGVSGNSIEVRYAKNTDSENAPSINNSDRNPSGWSITTINPGVGEYIWETRAYVSGENELVGVWSAPFRNTGLGQSLYTWIKYADTPTSGMSDAPEGKQYIGIGYNKTSPSESLDYSDYEWFLATGEGIPGPAGEDGQSLYTWVKYADTSSGVGLSDDPSGKDYIGLSYNNITPTESNNPLDYTWSLYRGPQGLTGAPGATGPTGPTVVLRFDYDPTAEYYGSSQRVEMVKYNGNGYQTKTTAGAIPVGTLPTNTAYWEGPITIDEKVWADVLIAYNAYIGDLVVGQISTGVTPLSVPDPNNLGERFTAGFQPTAGHDPTSNNSIFSRHGIRQYHPSGRIQAYIGNVKGLVYDIGSGAETLTGWATVVFNDDENSSIFSILDGVTPGRGVAYSSGGSYYPVGLIAESTTTPLPNTNPILMGVIESTKRDWNSTLLLNKGFSCYIFTPSHGDPSPTRYVKDTINGGGVGNAIDDGAYIIEAASVPSLDPDAPIDLSPLGGIKNKFTVGNFVDGILQTGLPTEFHLYLTIQDTGSVKTLRIEDESFNVIHTTNVVSGYDDNSFTLEYGIYMI